MINPHLIIRSAHVDDALRVAEIDRDSRRAAYKHFMAQSYLDSLETDLTLATWQETLRKPATECQTWVAEKGDQILGFATLGGARDAPWSDKEGMGEFWYLYLDPEARGHGVGRALFDWVVAEARKAGMTDFYLDTFEDNPAAHQFYEHMGMTHADDKQRLFGGDYYPARTYTLSL